MEKGRPNQELQKSENIKKSWYKERVINKTERELEEYKQNSPSWIFFNRVFGIVLDLLGWIVLGTVLYIGWQSGRWDTTQLTCNMISPEFCNTCFVYGGDVLGRTAENISNLLGGLNAN